MLRLVAFILLLMLPACGSVPDRELQARDTDVTGSVPPPPDCDTLHRPGTPEHRKCLDDKSGQKWGTVYLMAGSLVVLSAAGAAFLLLSDENAKTDIVRVGALDNGLPLYRFRYRGGSEQQFVGVMAQDVQRAIPDAVVRGSDGYLRVDYGKLGLRPMTWETWQSGGYVHRPLPHDARAAVLLSH